MATNKEIALEILSRFVEGARGGRVLWTYGDLATATGRDGQHRLLGGPLDALRDHCVENGLPDVATVVVSKESLAGGSLKPSPKALGKYGGWPGPRQEQARVIAFDWAAVRC